MKKTDLERNKASKLQSQLKQGNLANRFSGDAAEARVDRREQRKLDQEQGLVSFPVKIKQALVDEIRAQAAARNVSSHDIVGELLEKALKA